ncbi:MAG: hypothetical protein QOH25_3133 [Acidobacteriota bacterium]|jgi:hypothetical protein|nr:hypothetical protein [Acidobacteriota bacterium]
MNKPSRFPQSKASSSSVQQMRKQPGAPPVYRPQPTPQVLQRKAVGRQSAVGQIKPAPAAPPVYRPQPTPKVLQRKVTQGQSGTAYGKINEKHPVTPPVYRPQPVPKVLQTKVVGSIQPKPTSVANQMCGPHYMPKGGQRKNSSNEQIRLPQHPLMYTNQCKPMAIQRRQLTPHTPNNAAQMKAGVESFKTIWHNHDRGPTGAGYKIEFQAKFKEGDGFSAADAEFRQHAYHTWKKTKQDGTVTKGEDKSLPDDNYNRATDPEHYNGQDFAGMDHPGWQTGQLEATTDIEWLFKAEQYIVDTSDGDKPIAYIPTQTVTIKGAHPREFSPLPQVHPAVILRKRSHD